MISTLVASIHASVAVRQLTSRQIRPLFVRDCWVGPCTVELRPSEQAPLSDLGVVRPLSAFHCKADITLEPGRVRHTYESETE